MDRCIHQTSVLDKQHLSLLFGAETGQSNVEVEKDRGNIWVANPLSSFFSFDGNVIALWYSFRALGGTFLFLA